MPSERNGDLEAVAGRASGSGTMPTYNIGRFGVSNDDVRVYSALPDVSSSQQILIGGAFQ